MGRENVPAHQVQQGEAWSRTQREKQKQIKYKNKKQQNPDRNADFSYLFFVSQELGP